MCLCALDFLWNIKTPQKKKKIHTQILSVSFGVTSSDLFLLKLVLFTEEI